MASSSTPPPPPPEGDANEARNWTDLPPDVTATILKKVGVVDLLQIAQKVCMSWRIISKDPAMWRSIEMRESGDDEWEREFDMEKMAKHAIDRSCGQLVEFIVEGFGSDELLQYVGDRASQLRRLQLVCPYSISDEGLSEVAKKLPLLEELYIYFGSVSKESLASVGRSCPQLKTLRFNYQGSRPPNLEDDGEALAIAETMPGLHHLQLFGNNMTNDGLKAILDSCPHLESLDLRQCFNVDLGGTLGERCSERIKYLWQPYDSSHDCGFDISLYDRYDDEYSLDDLSAFSEIEYMSGVDDGEFYEFSSGSDISEYDATFYAEFGDD